MSKAWHRWRQPEIVTEIMTKNSGPKTEIVTKTEVVAEIATCLEESRGRASDSLGAGAYDGLYIALELVIRHIWRWPALPSAQWGRGVRVGVGVTVVSRH